MTVEKENRRETATLLYRTPSPPPLRARQASRGEGPSRRPSGLSVSPWGREGGRGGILERDPPISEPQSRTTLLDHMYRSGFVERNMHAMKQTRHATLSAKTRPAAANSFIQQPPTQCPPLRLTSTCHVTSRLGRKSVLSDRVESHDFGSREAKRCLHRLLTRSTREGSTRTISLERPSRFVCCAEEAQPVSQPAIIPKRNPTVVARKATDGTAAQVSLRVLVP